MSKIRVLDLGSDELKGEFAKIDVDRYGSKIMLPKGSFYTLKIEGTSSIFANIIKQQMLSNGGDVAVSRGSIDGSKKNTDCIIMGTEKQYQELTKKLKIQPWGLSEVSKEIEESLERFNKTTCSVVIRGKKISFGKKTKIMGVVNVTPDSFSDGGIFLDADSAINQVYKLVDQGADIIDIGGESSRPGADTVKASEELRRIIPVIRKVRKKIDVPISIDTRKSKVAKEALDCGADIVNDISSFSYDTKMVGLIAKRKAPVILCLSRPMIEPLHCLFHLISANSCQLSLFGPMFVLSLSLEIISYSPVM